MSEHVVESGTAWYLVRPPSVSPSMVERPRVMRLIDDAVSEHPLTIVAAPAGFGKTTAVASWARTRPEPVAWLSAGGLELTASTVISGIAAALSAAGLLSFADQFIDLDPGFGVPLVERDEERAAVRALAARWPTTEQPVTIVVDDVHGLNLREMPHVRRQLTALPAGVHVVLVGRANLAEQLARELAYGAATVVRAEQLAMDADEVAAVLEGSEAPWSPQEVTDRTGGWPLAVRAAASGAVPAGDGGGDLVPAIVRDEVLAQVRPELADFMLAATATIRLDADLARALAGPWAAQCLETCVELGLFLTRVDGPDRAPQYQWHEAFARACQDLLARRDLDRLRKGHRIVAEHIATTRPLDALRHALTADDAELLDRLLRRHWPEVLASGRAAELDRVLARWSPRSGPSDQVLKVRACALAILGDRSAARAWYPDGAPGDEDEFTHALVAATTAEDPEAQAEACERAARAVATASGLSPASHASALHLLGWIETRLRRNPTRTIATLRAAVREAHALGLHEMRRRATADLAAALTVAGRHREALSVLDELDETRHDAHFAVDGAVAGWVRGYAAFWDMRYRESYHAFRATWEREGPLSIAGGLARAMGAQAACAWGDVAAIDEAEVALEPIDVSRDLLGLPLRGFVSSARAAIAERRGQNEAAMRHLTTVEDHAHLPAMQALAVIQLRRMGHHERAALLAERLRRIDTPIHVRTTVRLTRALTLRSQGRFGAAHGLLESVLAEVDLHGCRQTVDPRREAPLRALMQEHAHWGTKHEDLVLELLEASDAQASSSRYGLTDRELVVLNYMRTTMSVTEIARQLFISVNTVKTHQRSLYRKLGVQSRREAIRMRV